MTKFSISSKAGADYGTYEGVDQKGAFMAMLRDSGDEGNYGEPHVGTEADWNISEVNEDARTYAENTKKHGEISFEGRSYALIAQAEPTNRIFGNSWDHAADGEEYTAEYSAPAIGEDGEEYVVRWQFTMVRGQEPEDGADLPCDWTKPSVVIPA